MEALKKRRASAKAKITRIQTFLDSSDNIAGETLQARLECLESAWSEYNRIHYELIANSADGEEETLENDCLEVETKYCNLKAELSRRIKETNSSRCGINNGSANIKLPRIELPTFSGNFLEWSAYRDLFTSVIHNNESISASQKLHYLKGSLNGEAAGLLHSIEITDANYAEAWKLLNDRYQNDRQLIQCHLKALFSQSALSTESASGIRKLLDNTAKHTRALSALGVPTDHWDHVLVYMLTERLDAESRKQWELSSGGSEFPKLDDLKAHLEQRCRALEASSAKSKLSASTQGAHKLNGKHGLRTMAASSLHTISRRESQGCYICGSNHSIYKCSEFSNLSEREKLNCVRKHSLCFNCLRPGHMASQCVSNSSCHKCGARHHSFLHLEKPTEVIQHTGNSDVTVVTNHVSERTPASSCVTLSTAVVRAKDRSGYWHRVRALLDSGSQASLISESCAQRLGLKRTKANVSVIGVGQTHSGLSRASVELELASCSSNFKISLKALVINKLTGYLPSGLLNAQQWAEELNITMADDLGNHGPIEIILGADVFGDLLLDGRFSGSGSRPSLFNTQFGWVQTGRATSTLSQQPSIMVNFANMKSLDQLRCFWELEETAPVRHLTPEEKECESHFVKTHSRDKTGRYIVRLPLKEDEVILGTSKTMATNRLYNLENKLNRQPDNLKQYHDFMKEYQELGHMELVPVEQRGEEPSRTNYLPHHFVLKPDSSTTKLRVVFDASAQTSSGTALNDKLMTGPKLQNEIWDILIRFRSYNVALVADIAKMYRQITVRLPDADLQRILWRWNRNEAIQEYRLTTVTYGTACAPYIATRVLHQLADDEGEHNPVARNAVLNDFYVDDLISGADSVPNAIELQRQLISLLAKGGFTLRKWSSNEPELIDSVPEDCRGSCLSLSMGSENTVKTLGVYWNSIDDTFIITVDIPEQDRPVTKRRVLSEVSRLFDPLGWMAPVVITAKIFIQRLWLMGVSWDETVSEKLKRDWVTYRNELGALQDINIKRCVFGGENASHELHGFCDASESAYGAVIYLRVVRPDGVTSTHLLCAKTRVAPLKQVSLPRLELCGAVLLARLVKRLQLTINIKLQAIYLWTDSTICLSWISGSPRNWKTFVANRVAEIQDIAHPGIWRHVPSKENPADHASRGLQPSELGNCALWWYGPTWLSKPDREWPKFNEWKTKEDTT